MKQSIDITSCDMALVGMIAIREYIERRASSLPLRTITEARALAVQMQDACRALAIAEDTEARAANPTLPDVAS